MDPDVLSQQLEIVQDRGFASTSEEHEMGLAAVAPPVRSIDGGVVAAVTVSGPTFRVNEDMMPALATHVFAAADEIWRATVVPSAADRPVPTRPSLDRP